MRIAILATLSLAIAAPLARAEFALRDGDTLAFLGDSITAARGYTKIVEHYTLMRFPDRKVRFINAGQGGDTAEGSLKRLDRDVLDAGATVVTVAFGINDIGWGVRANEDSKQRYLEGIRQIVERCKARGVRPIICSPAITAEAPDKAETNFLQRMTDEGMALAKSLGAETIDLQRGMRAVQRKIVEANAKEKDPKKHTHLHVEDGIHLSDLGQLAMAYAMLKGLGVPADVSSATIDAASGAVTASEACTISDVKRTDDGIEFTRLDTGLPLNLGVLSVLNYRWVPVPDGINRYLLKVTGLPGGTYEVFAAGRSLGKEKSSRLEEGLNLAHMTGNGWEPGGPWNAQSDIVKDLVDARDKLWAAASQRARFLPTDPARPKLTEAEHQLESALVAHQRATAKPWPYRFQIRRVEKDK